MKTLEQQHFEAIETNVDTDKDMYFKTTKLAAQLAAQSSAEITADIAIGFSKWFWDECMKNDWDEMTVKPEYEKCTDKELFAIYLTSLENKK